MKHNSFEEKRFNEVLKRLRQLPRIEGERTAEEIYLAGKTPCLVRLESHQKSKRSLKLAVIEAESVGIEPKETENKPYLILAEKKQDRPLRRMSFSVGPHPPKWLKEMMFLDISALSGLHLGYEKASLSEALEVFEKASCQ